MDSHDLKILAMLQDEGRLSNADIGRQLDRTPSAILSRIRKLRSEEVIRRISAQLDRQAVGFQVLAFVSVQTDERPGDPSVGPMLAAIPQVLEVHDVAGDDCFLLKVVGRDIPDLHEVVRVQIGGVPHVLRTRTTIVMEVVKETTAVPVP